MHTVRNRLLVHALEHDDRDAAAELERLARRSRDDEALVVALAVGGDARFTPSQVRERWLAICQLLEWRHADPRVIDRALDRHWSQTARTLPAAWIERLRAGRPGAPFFAIVRSASPETVADLERLLEVPELAGLTHLDLSACHAGWRSCQLLAAATGLRAVRELDLTSTGLDDADCEHLAASPHLAALERLSLGRNRIGDGGCRALAEASHLGALRELDLHANEIGDDGALALSGATWFADLHTLALQHNQIGLETYRTLARLRRPQPYTDLVFDFACALTDDCARDFLEALELKTLAVLALTVGFESQVRLDRQDLVLGILDAVASPG